MAEEQVTTALSSVSFSGSPLTNFPLPRELRDKIYGYLLDGDYTRVRRTFKEEERKSAARLNHTGPQAYHFHTNILAVNRTIHKETEELLYKRNAFIVISFQWPSLNTSRGGLFSVPVVSSKLINRMQLHSTRIHISPGTNLLRAAKAMSGVETPLQAYIILARDIDAFCCTVNVSAGSANAPCVHVSAQSKTAIKLEDMNTQGSAKAGKPIQLKCDFRGTKYPSMSTLSQQKILRSLASIISPSQRVVFTGNISDVAQIEDTKRIMSPTLVYPTVIWWSVLGNLIMVKDVADASIEHDDLHFVIISTRTSNFRSMNSLGLTIRRPLSLQ